MRFRSGSGCTRLPPNRRLAKLHDDRKEIHVKSHIAFLAAFAIAAPALAQEVYVSDPPHTQAFFEVGHLGIAWIRGRFNAVDAKVMLDRSAKQGTIEAVIKTASLDTGHEARDKHLRSADYLDVEKFPTMMFKSGNLKFAGDTLTGADGELTIMGVTRPVSLNVSMFRCIQHPANKSGMCYA